MATQVEDVITQVPHVYVQSRFCDTALSNAQFTAESTGSSKSRAVLWSTQRTCIVLRRRSQWISVRAQAPQQLNRTVFPFHLEAKTAAPERFLHFSDFAYWLFTLRWLILNLFCLINYLSALPSVPRLDWALWIIYCYSCWSDQRITTTVLSWVGELPVLGLRRWLDNKWWRDDRFRMYPWSSEGSSRQKSPVRWVAVLRPALTADRRHVLITQQQQQQQSVL